MTIKISRDEVGRTVIFVVEGSVDIASSPELRGSLRLAVEQKRPRIVVDLSGVTFVDSSGLATLIEALQGTKRYDGDLVLCALAPTVLGVFQLANLDNIFQLATTREEALGE
ncbi:MAG: STAS domain-containing protein [Planctomycetota bacterium]|jgi:anti-sigma B factor antagonist